MASPVNVRFWKRKAVLFGMEMVYGTDPVLTGLLNWFEARNVTLSMFEADSADQNIEQPYMGNGGKLITALRKKITFDLALAASGSLGVAPKIGKALRACGFAETVTPATRVEYTLISSSFESAAFYINIDGILHKSTGARGEVSVSLDPKGIPVLKVEMTGLYLTPVDAALPTVDRTGWPIEKPVNAANTQICTLNGVNAQYSKFGFKVGNQVVHDIYGGGYEQVKISDRQPTANITILAELLATFNPFALAEASTNIPVQVVHGATAGNKVQVDLKALILGVTDEDVAGNAGYGLTLQPKPVTGNDEIKLTFL